MVRPTYVHHSFGPVVSDILRTFRSWYVVRALPGIGMNEMSHV